jgi:hypothetical protein
MRLKDAVRVVVWRVPVALPGSAWVGNRWLAVCRARIREDGDRPPEPFVGVMDGPRGAPSITRPSPFAGRPRPLTPRHSPLIPHTHDPLPAFQQSLAARPSPFTRHRSDFMLHPSRLAPRLGITGGERGGG